MMTEHHAYGPVVLPRADMACRCQATDGMCHGWEGNTFYPVSWQFSTGEPTLRVTFTFEKASP